jgi:predicted hydrolase (HD superfamily)
MTGFLTACALVRPSRKIAEVEASSVKKKMKDKAFARGVNRDDLRKGAEELGVPLEEHIVVVRDAMAAIAKELGLHGAD